MSLKQYINEDDDKQEIIDTLTEMLIKERQVVKDLLQIIVDLNKRVNPDPVTYKYQEERNTSSLWNY